MRTSLFIGPDTAPALGDVRDRLPGDTIYLKPGVEQRKDWPRYADAISAAVLRGADVRWVRRVTRG